jgi:hypothetical protein
MCVKLQNYTLQALVSGLSTSKRLHFLLGGTFFLNPLRLNVLTGAMAQHAPAVGLSQGQLRGAVTNLGSIVSIFAGLVWPRVYAVGVRMGRPGLFYLPIAAVAVLQLLIVRTEMGGERGVAPAAAAATPAAGAKAEPGSAVGSIKAVSVSEKRDV